MVESESAPGQGRVTVRAPSTDHEKTGHRRHAPTGSSAFAKARTPRNERPGGRHKVPTGRRGRHDDGDGAAAAGIGIRRHFTTPDVDPYDTVEWERRDARIPNFKDGGDAFFQADVEFPTRGRSTPRTSSPRSTSAARSARPSASGRCARSSTASSTRSPTGASATATSSTTRRPHAFRAELKYVLVHQRAAFNSPVWFNIGVKGVPQQASACFILAVDDTMDAILNWYREEGIIFKGGSGAGINLSGIRSSQEHLKGGGTASGPVSFMRGADASAGTIKSGGKTRRAAKMVILDADHPDIEEFVWCKAIEERKARALATPASTWTSTAATATRSSTRTRTTRCASPTRSCTPSSTTPTGT